MSAIKETAAKKTQMLAFWETSAGFLKSVVSKLFPKYNQNYDNLNVKCRPKFKNP